MLRKIFFLEYVHMEAVRRDLSARLSYDASAFDLRVSDDELGEGLAGEVQSGEGSDSESEAVGFRRMESPPADPEKSACSQWRGRLLSTVLFAGSVAMRATGYNRWTNAIGSFGSGFFSAYAVSSGVEGVTEARIRQVCLTTFGQATFFALTQVFLNTSFLGLQAFLVQALIGQFGLNVAIGAKWLYQRGAVRVESNPPEGSKRKNPEHVECVGHKVACVAKILAASGCTAAYFLSSDRIVQGVASFGSTLFISQVFGEISVDGLDHQIEKNDSAEGTRYRIAKTVLLTLGHIVQPLIFIPWQNPGTAGRVKTLVWSGIALGFLDGASDRSERRRIQKIRDEDLEEFHKLKPPEKPKNKGCSRALFRYCAYRVFRYAVPLLSVCGMIGFTIWQVGWKLKTRDSKIALGMTLAGSLSSYYLSRKLDHAWDPNKRHWLIDKLMYALWASPRVLGINPLFIYYAVTNALEMDGHTIGATGESPYHVAAVILAWIAYGISMGRELYITESERVGNPQLKRPSLLYINGAITLYLYLSKVDP